MFREIATQNMVWYAAGVAAAAVALAVYRLHLTRDLATIKRTWCSLQPLLDERCYLVRKLSAQMRQLMPKHAHLVDDIEYVLAREDRSQDADRHAAVQNGLVLTVQTALDEYHQDQSRPEASALHTTLEAIGVVDSRIAPRRDLYNSLVVRHNGRLSEFPFSVIARVLSVRSMPEFPMLIPWWSTDDRLYSGSRAQQIKHMWETWKSPMIVPPSAQLRLSA